MGFIVEALLFFVPRYVEDRVALIQIQGVWSVYCREGQERDGDNLIIDAYGTIKSFTWLGLAKGGEVVLDN